MIRSPAPSPPATYGLSSRACDSCVQIAAFNTGRSKAHPAGVLKVMKVKVGKLKL